MGQEVGSQVTVLGSRPGHSIVRHSSRIRLGSLLTEWVETLARTARPHNMRLIKTANQELERDQARVQLLALEAVVPNAEVAAELVVHPHILPNL